jgi:hypothetical protein
MKRVLLASLAVLGASCTDGTTDKGVDPSDFNIDVQIDGFAGLEEGSDTYDSRDVNMCATVDGRVYVVWRDERQGPSDVWFNVSKDGGLTWAVAPIRVKQGRGNATGVHMTCSGSRVYVVWEDDRDGETGYENIYMNFTADEGATWEQDDIAIDNDPDGFAISLGPRVALWNGRVHVVWYDQVEGAPDVYMATSANGGKRFGPPVRVSGSQEDDGAGAAWSGNPEIALDQDGRAYVTWEDTRNGKQDIFFAGRADAETEFGPQKRIDVGDTRGDNYSFAPRIGADGGHTYIVWHDGRSGANRDIYMNYSPDSGETWLDAAVRVETDAMGFAESLNPDLIVEGNTAYIVWQDARNGGYDIFYRKVVAGDVEGADEEVRLDATDDEGAGNSAYPRITKQDSKIAVLWMDYRSDGGDGYNDLYYSFTDLAVEEPVWSDDVRVDSIGAGSSFTEDHHLAIYEDQLLSSWVDGRSGTRDVFFSRVTLGEAVDSLEDLAEAQAKAEGK